METLHFQYPGGTPPKGSAHVGVVGSGDLEILLEPTSDQTARIRIRTRCTGNEKTWKVVLDRFFARHPIAAAIEVNDFGATPGVVLLRLEQAWEVSAHDYATRAQAQHD
jgi:malonate decarboxylase delta subunit